MKIAGKRRLADSSDVSPPLHPRTYSAKSVSTFMFAITAYYYTHAMSHCAGLVSSKAFYQF